MAARDLTGHEVAALALRPSLRVRVPDHVVFREFPEQSVVLNLDRGHYHGLNRSGSMMFALLASGETVGAVAEAVSERYRLPPAQAQQDVFRLCATLLERGLLERTQPEQV
ncbi:MAG: PqqD family protein [Solirubrobacteraceae bacterium]